MNDNHWTHEQLVARLYGVGKEDDHLETCEACRARWERACNSRERMLTLGNQVPDELLRAQRRSILHRLEEPEGHFRIRMLPALAGILLILVVLTVIKPLSLQESAEVLPDTQLYQDVFSMASGASPSAVEPIESLFEVEQ